MLKECVTTRDCVQNNVIKECFEQVNFREDTFFCDCSNWYGWIGENCDNPSITIYYSRILYISIMFWCLFIFVTAFKSVFIYFKAKRSGSLKSVNPIVTVGVCNMSASIFFLITTFWKLPSNFNPKRFILSESESDTSNSSTYVILNEFWFFEDRFWMFATIFQSFTLLELVISLLNLLISLGKIFQEKDFISEKSAKISIRRANITLLFFCCSFVALNWLIFLSVFYMALALVITVSYIFCYRRFKSKVLKKQTRFTNRERKSLALITLTFKVIIFCRIIGSISGIIGLIGALIYRKYIKHGTINYSKLLLDIGAVTSCIEFTIISYYCQKITLKLLRVNQAVAWIPCLNKCGNSIKPNKVN